MSSVLILWSQLVSLLSSLSNEKSPMIEDIMLSEISETEKDKYHMISRVRGIYEAK